MTPETTNALAMPGRFVYNSGVESQWGKHTSLGRSALVGGSLAPHEEAAVRPAHSPELDLRVAEHALTLLARKRTKAPLTAGFMQALAQQGLNHRVGEARAAKMVAHLRAKKLIVQVGRYRGKRHGFWVPIFSLRSPSGLRIASVRRNSAVKGRSWWEHGLFGNPDGEKPVGATDEMLERWRSKPFRIGEWARVS